MNPKNQHYPILYAAYGANTNKSHMAVRCPTATYVGNCTLHDYELVFRGVADVRSRKHREVICAMWELQPRDEAALDAFEGYPRHYTKHYARISFRGESRLVMFYIMAGHRVDVHEPPRSYEATLRAGYNDCGMPAAQINDAIFAATESLKREKTYRGKWVREDQKAAAKKHGKRKSHYLSDREPGPTLREQPSLWPEVPGWLRANFDLTNIEDV